MKHVNLDSAGLTLVELVVCIALAGVIVIALSGVTNNQLHLSQRGRYLNLVNSFAESEIETLRNDGFNSLNIGTTNLTSQLPSQLPPKSSASMTVVSAYTGVDQVSLTITYPDQGHNNTYNYTSLIGELGVGR
jgi:hypothetical protein